MLFRAVFVVLMAITFSSCMLTSKMDKIVSEHYAGRASLRMPENTGDLVITSEGLPRVNGYCNSRYNHFFTVPLLVYTYSAESINCNINPTIYTSLISNEISRLLKNHPEKSENRIIEVSITGMPSSFAHKYNNHFVFVQFVFNNITLSFTKNELFNTHGSVVLNFTVKNKSTLETLNSGSVNVGLPYLQKIKFDNIQRKRFVQYYIGAFDEELSNASKAAAQNLIDKL